ncbi:uncharacterized protein EI97DRAFT_183328 [Westerdykella ornata]|uniref:Uncharacterized protein n=1 Tax=Westerdykella ornata TaxID=318751 RepID=A0A6A6JTS6_WESOR|nr:uncharacterized protein EI97DRAFT_183328 [Westerdykella ornata]KAF2279665.1 hypothetical protein EI97DRAFT_183328 [Westerdykella ornata]
MTAEPLNPTRQNVVAPSLDFSSAPPASAQVCTHVRCSHPRLSTTHPSQKAHRYITTTQPGGTAINTTKNVYTRYLLRFASPSHRISTNPSVINSISLPSHSHAISARQIEKAQRAQRTDSEIREIYKHPLPVHRLQDQYIGKAGKKTKKSSPCNAIPKSTKRVWFGRPVLPETIQPPEIIIKVDAVFSCAHMGHTARLARDSSLPLDRKTHQLCSSTLLRMWNCYCQSQYVYMV